MNEGTGAPVPAATTAAVVAEHGPWAAANIDLGNGRFTLGHDMVGSLEFMVHAITQSVADAMSKPLSQLRVLDLACGEGAYAVELAHHGATVVALEGRPGNVAKARHAAEVLGLRNLSVQQGDVRQISEEALGRFDVVLCLGILYHLEAEDAIKLLQDCYALTTGIVVIRTALGLSPNAEARLGRLTYRGRRAAEDVGEGHAALDNQTAILPTKTSLLNLLADVGFTSVVEVQNPAVPGVDDLIDSTTLIAYRGQALPYRSIPQLGTLPSQLRRRDRRGPRWLWYVAAPQQGRYWRAREAALHTVRHILWQSHRPIDAWRDEADPRP